MQKSGLRVFCEGVLGLIIVAALVGFIIFRFFPDSQIATNLIIFGSTFKSYLQGN